MIGLALTVLLPPPACTALGKAVVDHACVHARYGPHGEGPRVDQAHTYFRIGLPADTGRAAVTYVPGRSGEWILFTNPAVPLSVLDPVGQELPVRLEHDVAGCPELARASVFPLEAGTTYRVVLGPAQAPQVGLVFEKLSDFVLFYYADRDGDTHGDRASELETACRPPDHHVETAEDCDDRAAEVHPEAPELCNGRDDDCDGSSDEGCPGAPQDRAEAGSCQLAPPDTSPVPWLGLAGIACLLRFLSRAVMQRSPRTR